MFRYLFLCLVFLTSYSSVVAIDIRFDYSYDTEGFFADPLRRQNLEAAASVYESWFVDQLAPIDATGINSWNAVFPNPATGDDISLNNLLVPTNSVVVFAGGRDLGGQTLGVGGPGGWDARGTQEFIDTISLRNQGETSGNAAVDYAPWGGAITFDTTELSGETRDWWFGLNSLPTGGRTDFYSVALHELGHLLGFGVTDSFSNKINLAGPTFTGVNSSVEFGANAPLSNDVAHWRDGLEGISTVTGLPSGAVMDPTIAPNERSDLTYLDLAAFRDIGWTLANIPRVVAGDANGDGRVNLNDFQLLRANFGTGTRRDQGDLNNDKLVNVADFGILRTNFGRTSAAVPEPSSLALGTLWLAAAFTLWKKRSSK